MLVQNIKYNNIIYQKSPEKCNYSQTNFKGHVGHEAFEGNSIKRLVHETAFFREHSTDEFLKDFILKHWKNKEHINILCAACSTGEEAITFSMLLNEIKNKISILGIDISKDSIKEAKSGIYKTEYDTTRMTSAYSDKYLWLEDGAELSQKEKEYKTLFEDFFQKVQYNKYPMILNTPVKQPFIRKIFEKFITLISNENNNANYCGIFKLKENKAKNCKFKQGDIMHLDKITQNNKADIITFRNALYHLITIDDEHMRFLKLEAPTIFDKVVTKIENSLSSGGLVVFGKHEADQILSDTLIPEVLRKHNFKPLNKEIHHPTVWQKQD